MVVEVRHLSMRPCSRVPGEDEVAADVIAALAARGVASAHVVAHSYGTFLASRIVQLHGHAVASLALLDPVCFLMFTGHLMYNFVYRSPLAGGDPVTWFVARDLAHAASVARSFYWSQLNLWPEMLPAHSLVSLAGRDELVPVPEALAMLKHECSARLLWHPTHRHADFIFDLPWQAKVVGEVVRLAAEADADAGAGPGGAGLGSGHLHSNMQGQGQGTCQQQACCCHGRTDSASSYEGHAAGQGLAEAEAEAERAAVVVSAVAVTGPASMPRSSRRRNSRCGEQQVGGAA